MCHDSRHNQIDDKVGSTLQSHNDTDMGACIGSPFADDFGNDHNGLHFQDGSSEQDVSLSDLLEVLQKHENYSYEEQTTHENSVVASECFVPEYIDGLSERPSANCNVIDHKHYVGTDTEMVQEEVESI